VYPRGGTSAGLGRSCETGRRRRPWFKYAVIFLIISVIAGAIGLTNLSVIARRISLVLFVLFFLGFVALLGFAHLLGEAFNAGAQARALRSVLAV
jgi:uncharacterized membrane protein YtjA (UPF0391 family)